LEAFSGFVCGRTTLTNPAVSPKRVEAISDFERDGTQDA